MKKTDGQNVSRRDAIRDTGLLVGAALVAGAPVRAQNETPVNLNADELETLDAMCARIIPTDDNGPGAREARAARFIDRGLGGAFASSLDQYRTGLAGLERLARSTRGNGFAALPGPDQDALLESLQDNAAGDFGTNAAQFFNMVRGHTIQGTFSDPFYGGNANFVGWDMIGYPGVRTAVSAQYQQMDVDHPPNHQSVYDFAMFDEGEV
jgi:gluconate 2-dehydrogenase gamma chain